MMNAKASAPALLRRGQVAERLGVCPATLSLWVLRGEFPRPDVKVGMRTIRWKESTLEQWIDEQGGRDGRH